MLEKLKAQRDIAERSSELEEVARILSTLAIEGIFFSKEGLKQTLEGMGLESGNVRLLATIFGKNGGKK